MLKRNLLVAVSGLLAASIPGVAAFEMSERVQTILSLDRPLVIAHRGYSEAAPENTIPALQLGALAQADMVELDYYHSSDNVPVVFHDKTLDRTTNSRAVFGEDNIPVSSKSLTELRQLDAGEWFSPLFAGIGIPTLAEGLDVIQSESVTLIERKQGDARSLIDLLKEKEMLHDVVVQAFDWKFIADCHALVPELPLGALGPPATIDGRRLSAAEKVLNNDYLDQIQQSGAQVVGWNRQVTEEVVQEVHNRGMRIWIYTINDVATSKRLLEMGVDGIISNNPPVVWKALAERQTAER